MGTAGAPRELRLIELLDAGGTVLAVLPIHSACLSRYPDAFRLANVAQQPVKAWREVRDQSVLAALRETISRADVPCWVCGSDREAKNLAAAELTRLALVARTGGPV